MTMSETAQTPKPVVLSKVNAAHARQSYREHVGKEPPKTLIDVVQGLAEHFAKSKQALLSCDICGGGSPDLPDVETCPFCNDGKKDEDKPAPIVPAPSAEVVSIKPEKKQSSAPLLGLLAGGKNPQVSEKALDESKARLFAAGEKGAEAMFEVGIELRLMRNHLWQQRLEAGKPKYKSFKKFCEEELKMSEGHANRLRAVVDHFSVDQFRKYGMSFLRYMIAAPKDAHRELFDKIDNGEVSSARALEAEIKQIRSTRGISVLETDSTREAREQGKNIPTATVTELAAKSRKKPSAAVTLGLSSEEMIVKFMSRPAKSDGEEVPASWTRGGEDKPYAKVDTINGVTLWIMLRSDAAGNITGRLRAKRDRE